MICPKCQTELSSIYRRIKKEDKKHTWKKITSFEYCANCDKFIVAVKI